MILLRVELFSRKHGKTLAVMNRSALLDSVEIIMSPEALLDDGCMYAQILRTTSPRDAIAGLGVLCHMVNK